MSILFHFWSLPILFLLHDFEEIIVMPLWKKRKKFQNLKNQNQYFGATTNGSAFSVGVLEEFIILLIVSAICQLCHNQTLYLSFCIAYTFHFLIHYKMCYQFKGYVPGVVTVTLQIPIMFLLISHYWQWNFKMLVYFVITMIIVYTNLYVMHQIMPKIQVAFERYIKG